MDAGKSPWHAHLSFISSPEPQIINFFHNARDFEK